MKDKTVRIRIGADPATGEPVMVDPEWDPKELTVATLRKVIEFAREEFLNDGAEGETVHALCDALELRLNKENPF